MLKVGKNVKLPLKICKGSVPERLELAKQYNENFFNSICQSFKGKWLDKDVFTRNLKNMHNGKINFTIKDATPTNYKGNTQPMCTGKKVVSYDIYLPLNKFDKKMYLYDMNIFMHETFHYFFETINPKHIKNTCVMFENKLSPKTEKFYHNMLYNKYGDPDFVKILLPEYVGTFSPKEQITILQNWRYRLTEELNAYKEGAKYHEKIQEIYKDTLHEKFPCDDGSAFHFEEKIKIIEETLAKTLQKVRKNL